MSLQSYVSDSLLQFLGASDSTTVDYFVTLGRSPRPSLPSLIADLSPPTASSSKSASALLATLSANGLPASSAASSFATELFNRAPRKHKPGATGLSIKAKANADEARRKAEKEQKELQKQRFSLVLEDEVVESVSQGEGKKREKGKGKASSKSLRKQTGGGDAWESDEEERAAKRRREEERYPTQQDAPDEQVDEDPMSRAERQRLEDRKERDEFAARMKDKDKDRTKKLIEDRSSKVDAESLARRALAKDPTALEGAMPSLRERSRQSYLGKREQQQLDLLRIEIADDERDFRGVRLTKKEQADLSRKKELLRLAEERLAVDEGFDGYQMPDGESRLSSSESAILTHRLLDYITEQGKIDSKKKKDLLSARYSDAKPGSRNQRDPEFTTDLEAYETEQTAKAQLTAGAMDRKVVEDEYDFVFDESAKIDFALDSAGGLEGTMGNGKDAALQAQIDEAERHGEHPLSRSSTRTDVSFPSSIHRRGPQVPTRLRVARTVPRGCAHLPSPHHRGRDRIGQDDSTPPVPPRSRLYQGRPQDRLHSTSTSRCHVRRRPCRRRDGVQARERSRILDPIRGLHERQDGHQVHDGWYAAQGVLDGAGSRRVQLHGH